MACNSCNSATCTGCKDSSITLPPSLNKGTKGDDGSDGSSAYVYIGYATDATGGDFSTTPFSGATYISVKNTTTEQTNDVNLHAGNWLLVFGIGGDGDDGTDGTDGRGITQIVRTDGDGSAGSLDTYTITYSDATTSTFTVQNGDNGDDGADGLQTEILFGEGVPASGLGDDLDLYFNTTNGDVYKKSEGSWSLQGNFTGPKGDQGDAGNDGNDGADANTNYAALLYNADRVEGLTTTPAKITNWESSGALTYTADGSLGTLTISETVTGFVELDITATAAVGSNTITFEVYQNTSATAIKAIMVFGTDTTMAQTTSIRFPLAVTAADTLEVRASSTINTNITIKTGSFSFEAR